MLTYWELYVAYANHCVEDNYKNDIDPAHYEMEWNHWLPLAAFPDLPLGQWLTLRQHAIASALQSLALGENCLCGWHKKFLPELLLELAWPIYCEACGVRGKKRATKAHEEKDENGKSKHAIYIGGYAAVARGKMIELIRPDGEVFVFDTVNYAAKVLGIPCVTVRQWCSGKRKSKEGWVARYLPADRY